MLLVKEKSQTFVFGAVILMVSNILVKVIGAVFKIPLTNTIGVDGMAYFNAAYSIYVALYNISTSGLPVAVSRMVAAENSRGNLREVNRIFSVAFRLFFMIGLAGMLVMIAFSRSFAAFSKLHDSYLAMIAITNSVLQAYRFERKTILSTTAGIVVKIVLTYILSGVPGIGANGSAVGTAACYLTVFAFNLYFVIKYTHFVPHIRRIFLKPLSAGILCGATAVLTVRLFSGRIPDKLLTLIAILLAAVIYAGTLLLLKGFDRTDILMLPKGEKICRAMEKCGLLEKN